MTMVTAAAFLLTMLFHGAAAVDDDYSFDQLSSQAIQLTPDNVITRSPAAPPNTDDRWETIPTEVLALLPDEVQMRLGTTLRINRNLDFMDLFAGAGRLRHEVD